MRLYIKTSQYVEVLLSEYSNPSVVLTTSMQKADIMDKDFIAQCIDEHAGPSPYYHIKVAAYVNEEGEWEVIEQPELKKFARINFHYHMLPAILGLTGRYENEDELFEIWRVMQL